MDFKILPFSALKAFYVLFTSDKFYKDKYTFGSYFVDRSRQKYDVTYLTIGDSKGYYKIFSYHEFDDYEEKREQHDDKQLFCYYDDHLRYVVLYFESLKRDKLNFEPFYLRKKTNEGELVEIVLQEDDENKQDLVDEQNEDELEEDEFEEDDEFDDEFNFEYYYEFVDEEGNLLQFDQRRLFLEGTLVIAPEDVDEFLAPKYEEDSSDDDWMDDDDDDEYYFNGSYEFPPPQDDE